jgi:CubicO group peptidase (beta-lactamase class C family)
MKNLTLTVLFVTFSYISRANVNFHEISTALDKNVPAILKIHHAPGVAIAIVEKDKILGYKFYGFSDVNKQLPFTQDTMFNVGSISKVATAWGAMQLIQSEKVDLDNPINTYLKRWKIPSSEFKSDDVTLRNIMSHTSGLSLGPYIGWNTPTDLSVLDSLNGLNNGAGEVKLIHQPNTTWSYSGGGYSVIQLLIEDVTGQDFNQYMIEKVFKPMGMNNTTFDVTEDIVSVTAIPYDESGKETTMVYFSESAAAGMHTTAHDLALFTTLILKNKDDVFNGNKILTSPLIETMIKPVKITDGRWSMSYVVDSENKSLGFAGFNRGWITLTRAVIGSNYGYVILTNSSIGDVTDKIDTLILDTVKKSIMTTH